MIVKLVHGKSIKNKFIWGKCDVACKLWGFTLV